VNVTRENQGKIQQQKERALLCKQTNGRKQDQETVGTKTREEVKARHEEARGTAPMTVSLDNTWRWVNNLMPWQLYLWGNSHQLQTSLVGPKLFSGFLAEQKYILSKLVTEQFLKSPVCCIVTILTELL
jgi:hypothetical protein